MKLDFIDTGNVDGEDYRLLRLFDFNCEEVARFHAIVLELARGSIDTVVVHQLPYVRDAKVEVVLKTADKDYGILPIRDQSAFECKLTGSSWESLAGYLEPFLTACDHNTFQWLDESFSWTADTSEIGFLFSPDPNGCW